MLTSLRAPRRVAQPPSSGCGQRTKLAQPPSLDVRSAHSFGKIRPNGIREGAMHCLRAFADWLHNYESVALWVEGIALVAILLHDGYARHQEHRETLAHMDVARKQIHADRVAEIWKALRRFEHFIAWGRIDGRVGPGKDFSEHGNLGMKGGKIFQEYLDLQEAYYLSYLVSDPLAAFMKQRMEEADGLQRTKSPDEFARKTQEFFKNWDVYEMARRIRDLS